MKNGILPYIKLSTDVRTFFLSSKRSSKQVNAESTRGSAKNKRDLRNQLMSGLIFLPARRNSKECDFAHYKHLPERSILLSGLLKSANQPWQLRIPLLRSQK
jgi:hypothetical protein